MRKHMQIQEQWGKDDMGKLTADEAEYQIQNYNGIINGLLDSLDYNFQDMDFENVVVKRNMEAIKKSIIKDLRAVQDELNTLTFER